MGELQPGQLIFIASRYSMGKTALALNIAEYVAVHEDLPVAIFCLESCTADLKKRLASSISGIGVREVQTGPLHGGKLHIEGNLRVSVKELLDRARCLSDQHGKLGLIVVDDLQCTHFSAKRGQALASELRALSQGLKLLAQENDCPVIVPTQLGRALEMRLDKRPRLTDLRAGGKQEQEADMIITVYRDDYYTSDASQSPGFAEISVVKHRCGNTGCVRLAFNKSLTKFENLASTHQEYL
jgi:replicative DNA helicase